MNLDTLGIVASQGEEYCTPQCRKLMIVQNKEQNGWTTRMLESGDEMVVAALRIAKDTVKGESYLRITVVHRLTLRLYPLRKTVIL
ncbi:TPA: hypothetical protein ACU9K7_003249 [Salmonella enterica]|nr:hypothetical protein [Salmonella enterica subsp. enterica serovar Miami]